ncbi:MAG: hypothetical protein AAFW47_06710, partial [Pseudomonadota bacterium]
AEDAAHKSSWQGSGLNLTRQSGESSDGQTDAEATAAAALSNEEDTEAANAETSGVDAPEAETQDAADSSSQAEDLSAPTESDEVAVSAGSFRGDCSGGNAQEAAKANHDGEAQESGQTEKETHEEAPALTPSTQRDGIEKHQKSEMNTTASSDIFKPFRRWLSKPVKW